MTVGDHIDGRFIQAIYQCAIAIDSHGQVLYQAFFSESDNYEIWNGHEGLFLDRHLISIVEYDAGNRAYAYGLSEDYRAVANHGPRHSTETREQDQASRSTILALVTRPVSARQARGAIENGADAWPFATNPCRGEFPFPVELKDGGRFLFLASLPQALKAI